MFDSVLNPWANVVLLVLPVMLPLYLHRPVVRSGSPREYYTSMRTESYRRRTGVPGLWIQPQKDVYYPFLCLISLSKGNSEACKKKEDSCSQISPLKKYIKRTHHLAVWGMTTAEGGTLGLEVICGGSASFFDTLPVFAIDASQQIWQKTRMLENTNG